MNHLRSVIDIEHPTEGARVRTKRAAQAEFVAALIDRRLRDEPGEQILVIGDLNAFEFSDGFVDGSAQTLDHMLVSESLLARVADFMHVRGNADSPEIWRSDASRPERISDHDPALIYLRFP